MARISETYLSTLSEKMKSKGIERYFMPFLYLCENSGKLTQKDLAEALKRDKVTIMRMVDYLSEIGLVKRKCDPNDRRCQILEVTDKAYTLVDDLKEAISQTNDLLFKEFTEEERALFTSGMEKLIRQIDQLPDSEFIIHATKKKK